ncbi:MAG: hypothetical protein ACXVWZ_10500 [Nocardioides sp.]
MTKSRQLGLAAASLLFVGTLSGCGVAGTDFHPGVAAHVGDDTISVDRVDSLVGLFCSAIESQQPVGTKYRGTDVRGGLVGLLTMKSAAEQIAADHGVGPGPEYSQTVAQLRDSVASLPKDEQAAVVEIQSASTYVRGVEQAVGTEALAASGNAKPTQDQALKAGNQVFATWFDQHQVQIDPQFGVTIKDGAPAADDTSLSLAVGADARAGAAPSADPSYVAGLPASHTCG